MRSRNSRPKGRSAAACREDCNAQYVLDRFCFFFFFFVYVFSVDLFYHFDPPLSFGNDFLFSYQTDDLVNKGDPTEVYINPKLVGEG